MAKLCCAHDFEWDMCWTGVEMNWFRWKWGQHVVDTWLFIDLRQIHAMQKHIAETFTYICILHLLQMHLKKWSIFCDCIDIFTACYMSLYLSLSTLNFHLLNLYWWTMWTIYQAIFESICSVVQILHTQEKQLNYVNMAENRNEAFAKLRNPSTRKKTPNEMRYSQSITLHCIALNCAARASHSRYFRMAMNIFHKHIFMWYMHNWTELSWTENSQCFAQNIRTWSNRVCDFPACIRTMVLVIWFYIHTII